MAVARVAATVVVARAAATVVVAKVVEMEAARAEAVRGAVREAVARAVARAAATVEAVRVVVTVAAAKVAVRAGSRWSPTARRSCFVRTHLSCTRCCQRAWPGAWQRIDNSSQSLGCQCTGS